MVKDNNVTKLAIVGNTKLTKKSIDKILEIKKYKIVSLFGLKSENRKNKVNAVDLRPVCEKNKILLDESEDWDSFYNFCLENKIDMILCLGDSRIVPKKIVNNFKVIGNHGALLPHVKGGASLVWGRMLNLGHWGISIMTIDEKIDRGKILKTKSFKYTPHTTQSGFVRMADDLTVEALIDVLRNNPVPKENRKYDVRLVKHIDSQKACQIYKFCMENNLCIYLPPRTPEDGKVRDFWPDNFVKTFKTANSTPYPSWK